MNFIRRISERLSKIRLWLDNKPPPPPDNNSKFLFERVISIFQPKKAISEEEEKAIHEALRLVNEVIKKEVSLELEKLRKLNV